MGELTGKGKARGTFKLRYLPHDIVASGEWYRDEKWKQQYPSPAVILNNWIVGNGDKVTRAIQYGHFFYDVDNGQCMDPKANAQGMLRGGV
jgi:hypothetical protein